MTFRWPEHRVTQNRTGASDAPVGRPEHEVTIRSMRYPFTTEVREEIRWEDDEERRVDPQPHRRMAHDTPRTRRPGTAPSGCDPADRTVSRAPPTATPERQATRPRPLSSARASTPVAQSRTVCSCASRLQSRDCRLRRDSRPTVYSCRRDRSNQDSLQPRLAPPDARRPAARGLVASTNARARERSRGAPPPPARAARSACMRGPHGCLTIVT